MADKSDSTVVVTKKRSINRKQAIIIVVIIVVLAGGFGLFKLLTRRHSDTVSLQSLQRNLQTASNNANAQGMIDVVNGILSGQATGDFSLTKPQLSTYYLDRANAYLNLKQYKNAVSDYEQAAQLDSNNKLAALQSEVEARYDLGERQQLVPLYQQLITLKTNSDDPMRGSEIAQYKDNIQTLQQGGGLQF